MSTAKATESTLTVAIAFAANLLIAIGKTVAALVTGSASITAEAAHSWADAGNEVFLLIADRRSAQPRDATHPLGYGREAWVWSLYAAFGLFTAGAVVSIMHGVRELVEPEATSNWLVAYSVLGVAFVLEGVSFAQAYRQARASAARRGETTLAHVLSSSNTTLRAVFAEDAAALLGLTIAFLGVLLHQLTGSPIYDAVGSILVGVLLGVVALVLINRSRMFLIGQVTNEALTTSAIEFLLARPEIARVTYLHLEYVGPDQLFLVAAVDITGNAEESDVARALRRVQRELEANEHIVQAVLTLSTPDEASIVPVTPEGELRLTMDNRSISPVVDPEVAAGATDGAVPSSTASGAQGMTISTAVSAE